MGMAKRMLEELESRRTRKYKCPTREIEPDVEGCGEYDLHIEMDTYAECLACGLQIFNESVINEIWEEGDYDGHHSEEEIVARGW